MTVGQWCHYKRRCWFCLVVSSGPFLHALSNIYIHNIQHVICAITFECYRYCFLTHLVSNCPHIQCCCRDRLFSTSLPPHPKCENCNMKKNLCKIKIKSTLFYRLCPAPFPAAAVHFQVITHFQVKHRG